MGKRLLNKLMVIAATNFSENVGSCGRIPRSIRAVSCARYTRSFTCLYTAGALLWSLETKRRPCKTLWCVVLLRLEHQRRRMKIDTRTNFDWLSSSYINEKNRLNWYIYAKIICPKTLKLVVAINSNPKVALLCIFI